MTELVLEDLTVTRGGLHLVHDVNVRLSRGELVVLLGPNGAGKTTLLRAALGLISPNRGCARIDGSDMQRLPARERARRVTYLPQTRPLAWAVMVSDVVALGRFAHGAAPGRLLPEDAGAVARAMARCGIETLAQRSTATLSGGELARVHLARAVAAETPLWLADEPVAALDPRHQHQVMALFRRYADDGGGALCVLHDIALAARFADRLVWMKDGAVVADGTVAETLTPERLADVYGVRARVEVAEGRTHVVIEGPS